MITLLTKEVQERIGQVVVELIELRAVRSELNRSFPYLTGSYYYQRLRQIDDRIQDIEEILIKANVGFVKDAPSEQYLITKIQ